MLILYDSLMNISTSVSPLTEFLSFIAVHRSVITLRIKTVAKQRNSGDIRSLLH